MPAIAIGDLNRLRRQRVLDSMEARLNEIWPDGDQPASTHIGGFDDLEAFATEVGDAATCQIMEDLLQHALSLPVTIRQVCCEKCGSKLQYSRKTRTINGIRGPVTFEREYAYCRKCRSGFFPC